MLVAEHHLISYASDVSIEQVEKAMEYMKQRYPYLVEGVKVVKPDGDEGKKQRIELLLDRIWKLRHGKVSFERST